MRRNSLVPLIVMVAAVLMLLLLAASTHASPIVPGGWAPVGTPDLEVDKSEDDECGIPGKCAGVWLLTPGAEFAVGSFAYTDWTGGTVIRRLTEYTEGELHWDGSTFNYYNGHDYAFNSWVNYDHMRLARRIEGDHTRYWLMVEDLFAPTYFDYNDMVLTWKEDTPVEGEGGDIEEGEGGFCEEFDCEGGEGEGDVPEPASLTLLGIAALASTRRLLDRRR